MAESRVSLFPIEHRAIWELYQQQLASFWTAAEVDLSRDVREFALLSEDEKHFIRHVLAFFASADLLVNVYISERFIHDVKDCVEAQVCYNFQRAMEDVHSTMYSILIDTYIQDSDERRKTFNAIKVFPAIREKAEWCDRWTKSERSFSERLVAFICTEGIHFSGSFCAIYYFKSRGLLPGLTLSNEFIARDESNHCRFGALLYLMRHDLTDAQVHAIVHEAVDIETRFITEALPCRLIGMNAELMTLHIKSVADSILSMIGHSPMYNVANTPFDFMVRIGLHGKANFFEMRESSYQKASVLSGAASLDEVDDF